MNNELKGNRKPSPLAKGIGHAVRSIGAGIAFLLFILALVVAFNGDELADWFMQRF